MLADLVPTAWAVSVGSTEILVAPPVVWVETGAGVVDDNNMRYADLRRMEEIVMASDLDWTIARPAQLVDAATVGACRVAEKYMIPGMKKAARIDLADFMLEEAVNPRHVRKAVAVATR